MATFTAGTSFTDGVTGDVTASKLNALVANATPLANLITDRTAETSIATDDLVLISDTSESGALNKMTVANFTNIVSTGTGTASDPAIRPTGDTNTGIFFPAADTIAFSEGGTESMRIDSSGNVGVGTSSPSYRMSVDTSAQTILSCNSTDAIGGYATFLRSGSVKGFVGSAQPLVSGGSNNDFAIRAESNLVFATNTNTERLRIDSSGNVGIGTNSPSAQLELSTDSAKKPSTNTWTIASDARLKTNIVDADKNRCYEIVKEVPLKRYTWKNEVYSQDQVRDRSKLGWIAQDVEAVFPKAVGTNRFAYNQVFEDVVTQEVDPDGNPVLDENGNPKTKTEKRLVSEDVIEDCKDLNSDQIYAVMYGTIQKLIEKVEALESKVAALEAA